MVEVAEAEMEGVLVPVLGVEEAGEEGLEAAVSELAAGRMLEVESLEAWTERVVGSGCCVLVFTKIPVKAPRTNIPASLKLPINFSGGSIPMITQAAKVIM